MPLQEGTDCCSESLKRQWSANAIHACIHIYYLCTYIMYRVSQFHQKLHKQKEGVGLAVLG